MLHQADWWMVTDISKDHSAFIVRCQTFNIKAQQLNFQVFQNGNIVSLGKKICFPMTCHNISEALNFQQHCIENLRSRMALKFFKASVIICQSAWCNIPEDLDIQHCCCENLKSYCVSAVRHSCDHSILFHFLISVTVNCYCPQSFDIIC